MKSSTLIRRKALRRTKFMVTRKKTKQAQREGDAPWLGWIRSLPCCSCGARPPNHPHHATGGGMGRKSHDRETMPLCFRCHRDFHDGNGKFDGWNKAQRRLFQDLAIERLVKAALLDPTAPSQVSQASRTG